MYMESIINHHQLGLILGNYSHTTLIQYIIHAVNISNNSNNIIKERELALNSQNLMLQIQQSGQQQKAKLGQNGLVIDEAYDYAD